jgi:hypothetical protein
MRQSKLFIEGVSQKMFRYLLALNKKQCILVSGMLSGNCLERHHLSTVSQKVLQDRKRNPTIVYSYFVNPKLWLGTEQRSLAFTVWADRYMEESQSGMFRLWHYS